MSTQSRLWPHATPQPSYLGWERGPSFETNPTSTLVPRASSQAANDHSRLLRWPKLLLDIHSSSLFVRARLDSTCMSLAPAWSCIGMIPRRFCKSQPLNIFAPVWLPVLVWPKELFRQSQGIVKAPFVNTREASAAAKQVSDLKTGRSRVIPRHQNHANVLHFLLSPSVVCLA